MLFRVRDGVLELLLGHMGGPFWARKDDGAWSIPKGELLDGEDPLTAARREFAEELGHAPPDGPVLELGEVRQGSGKRVVAWFSVEAAAPKIVWSKNSAAMTKKNHAVARWAGVSATSPGVRKLSVACSRPCQPSLLPQRPKAANSSPTPVSSATSDSIDHTRTFAVGALSTRGSDGQLFVYE